MRFPRHYFKALKPLTNVSQANALVFSEIFDPATEVNAFEQVVRLVKMRKESIASAGDLVKFEGNHFLLLAHTQESRDVIYRLLPAPDSVQWTRPVSTIPDPVTGLRKAGSGSSVTTTIYCRKKVKSFGKDLNEFNKPITQYVTESPILMGDTLDGSPVKKVWVEEGVYLVET